MTRSDLFRLAHKKTKEVTKLYTVNYRVQFGFELKALYSEMKMKNKDYFTLTELKRAKFISCKIGWELDGKGLDSKKIYTIEGDKKLQYIMGYGWSIHTDYTDIIKLIDFIKTEEEIEEEKKKKELEEKREKEEKLRRKKEKEKKIKDLIIKAKETGKKQFVRRWADDCNDDNEACECDIICEYIDENGAYSYERNHTY
jgi:hypothetical protein